MLAEPMAQEEARVMVMVMVRVMVMVTVKAQHLACAARWCAV